jgi:hypothetical protein
MKNPIEELLEEVVRTGEVPTREAITAVITRGGESEREEAIRGIRVAAKKILVAQDDDDRSGLEETIADLVQGTGEKFRRVVRKGADDDRAEMLGQSSYDREGVERRRQANIAEKNRRAPLVEILRLAGPSQGVDPRDLGGLVLKAELSAEQQQQWRGKVEKAGERVARLHAAGNQGDASDLADELAEDLGEALAPVPAHRDPAADIDDPRQLSDLIRGKHRVV